MTIRKSDKEELAEVEKVDSEEFDFQPTYSQTRILRREPTAAFTRIMHSRANKWRKFSTLGHREILECPECSALIWNDSQALINHVNHHEFVDEQLGIEPEERPIRAMPTQKAGIPGIKVKTRRGR